MHKTFTGVFLLIAMAVVGLGLIWLPGWVIDNYQAAAGVGKVWGVSVSYTHLTLPTKA